MQTNHAYVQRRPLSEGGDLWGNWILNEELRAFPWLVPLVEALRAEKGDDLPGGEGWSALFRFDSARDRPTIVTLEMKSPGDSFDVPPLVLDPEHPASLADVLRHVRERAVPAPPESEESSFGDLLEAAWPDRV